MDLQTLENEWNDMWGFVVDKLTMRLHNVQLISFRILQGDIRSI